MPKEITHWKIALKAASGLEDDSFGRMLKERRNVYLLGAVLPDLPYYYLVGPKREEMMALAERLHAEHGEDSFESPRHFWKENNGDVTGVALLAGYLTHMAADSVFHPFVYAFSGCGESAESPYSPFQSRFRHFSLESRFDFYNMRHFPLEFDFRIKSLLRHIDKESVAEKISRLFFDVPNLSGDIRRLLHRQSVVQSLFFNPVLRLIRVVFPSGLSAAFYPVIKKDDVFFERRFKYAHPLSGREAEDSYLSLEKKAVELSLKWFQKLARGICFCENERGPSLATGMKGTHMDGMRFFCSDLTIRDISGF